MIKIKKHDFFQKNNNNSKTSTTVSQKPNLEIGKSPIFHLFLEVFNYTKSSSFFVEKKFYKIRLLT